MRKEGNRVFLCLVLFIVCGTLMFLASRPRPDEAILAKEDTWYQSAVPKSEIKELVITSSKRAFWDRAEEMWDASEQQNGSVMAYRDGEKLTITILAGENLILSPDAARTFSDFSALTEIRGLWKVDASNALDLSECFMNCTRLAQIRGAQNWNTDHVTDFHGMFEGCESLENLDLRAWNVESAVNMDRMFALCRKLSVIRIETWNCDTCSNYCMLYETAYDTTGAIYTSSEEMAKWVDRTDTLEEGGDKGIFFVINILIEK